MIDWEGENIKIGFQPVPPQLIDINSCQVETGSLNPPFQSWRQEFGPRPDTGSTSFDFKYEFKWLPSQLNIGKEANLTWEQQSHLINLIYDNKEIFLLHDEALGYCDQLKHTIPTTTDKPVYLPLCTIPRQLQNEVCKCLDTWLCQVIIWPSKTPYQSKVVVVHVKLEEIHLWVD